MDSELRESERYFFKKEQIKSLLRSGLLSPKGFKMLKLASRLGNVEAKEIYPLPTQQNITTIQIAFKNAVHSYFDLKDRTDLAEELVKLTGSSANQVQEEITKLITTYQYKIAHSFEERSSYLHQMQILSSKQSAYYFSKTLQMNLFNSFSMSHFLGGEKEMLLLLSKYLWRKIN